MLNELRELRLSKKIPAKEMVEVIQRYHPKFDKTMLSKCERGEDYGIHIKRAALDALYEKFAPELLPVVKKNRNGRHRLTKLVICRLEDADYVALQQLIEASDYETTQDWMANLIRSCLRHNEKSITSQEAQ